MEHPLTWFSLLPLIKDLPVHVSGAILVGLLLIVISFVYQRKQKSIKDALIPDPKFSLSNLMEVIGEWILSLLDDIVGPEGRKFLPLVGTVFIFILFNNLLGVIPGFSPPTGNLNTNAACAITVFLAYNYYGVKAHGWRYLKHFIGPVWWLFFLFLPVELISHLFRPITLSVRLFGNIHGDHTVLEKFLEYVPLGMPAMIMILGIIVSLVQAFVFALLTMIYIAFATAHE
ncbi:MAG: F0F1 ATP synthase subunit A [Deltaproteobacteria bacterium]|nr:MAG: F0F1 ATP synthase subunit A [Deltaproteobacteria bacterium]